MLGTARGWARLGIVAPPEVRVVRIGGVAARHNGPAPTEACAPRVIPP